MGDSQRENHELGVLDRVRDPVVAYPYTPQAGITDERSGALGARAKRGERRVGPEPVPIR
jgi:hypothetical protein